MTNDDRCPTCGERVEAAGDGASGAEQSSETTPQRTSCRSCGADLERALGEPWRVATGPGSDVS